MGPIIAKNPFFWPGTKKAVFRVRNPLFEGFRPPPDPPEKGGFSIGSNSIFRLKCRSEGSGTPPGPPREGGYPPSGAKKPGLWKNAIFWHSRRPKFCVFSLPKGNGRFLVGIFRFLDPKIAQKRTFQRKTRPNCTFLCILPMFSFGHFQSPQSHGLNSTFLCVWGLGTVEALSEPTFLASNDISYWDQKTQFLRGPETPFLGSLDPPRGDKYPPNGVPIERPAKVPLWGSGNPLFWGFLESQRPAKVPLWGVKNTLFWGFDP